jgi:hypothetical protein
MPYFLKALTILAFVVNLLSGLITVYDTFIPPPLTPTLIILQGR